MNSRVKGNRARRKCIQELQELGFAVDVVEKTSRFSKQKDMFGLFDLVAIHPDGLPGFIQVTVNRPHPHKKYKEFAKVYPFITVHQWVWVDYKGWRKFTYDGITDKLYTEVTKLPTR